jgi:hypothetical protein
MAKNNDYVRLNIDIPYPLAKRLDRIPWGLKSDVLRKLIAQFCDRMDSDGGVKAIYLLLEDKVNPTEELLKGRDFT